MSSESETTKSLQRKTSVTRCNALLTGKHVICMVGLPARGKTYIAKKLTRYLNWIGVNTKVFNVGTYRRKVTDEYHNHSFFDPENDKAMEIRTQVAEEALTDCLKWLQQEEIDDATNGEGTPESAPGDVAIFDATNVTEERRKYIYERVVEKCHYQLLFIESICDDNSLVEANIREVKLNGPDYEVEEDREKALKDFNMRIQHYLKVYVPLSGQEEDIYSFIKVINQGRKLVINRQFGALHSKIGYWLMHTRTVPKSIYLTRHGESEFNQTGKIGGDSNLSVRGRQYAEKLAEYVKNLPCFPDLRVWTSQLRRTIQTASGIMAPQERWRALNEIDAGVCEEMTYKEIEVKYPEDYAARENNKLTYRYPGGESYEDVIARVEAVIMELERQENVLVVGHQAILRCILCYFLDKPQKDLPYVKVPLHTVIKLTPIAYGCKVEQIPLGVEAVDTHRPKTAVFTNGGANNLAADLASPILIAQEAQ